MKRIGALAIVTLLAACMPLSAQNTSKMLADASGKASMLAVVVYNYSNDLVNQNVSGQALCIDASGIFATFAADPMMKAKDVQGARLVLVGDAGKVVKAELLWVDPETGMGFFRATEKGAWTPAKFDFQAKFAVGSAVASIGIVEGDPTAATFVSSGLISTVLRTPEPLVYVVNGNLTGDCSPVFNEAGAVVGVVAAQPFMHYQTNTQQGGQADILLKARQQATFFSPAANFAAVLDYLAKTPDKPRQMPWMGALSLEGLSAEDIRAEGITTGAVAVGQVIPETGGAKAGLKERDIIIAVNGSPIEKQPTPAFVVQTFQRKITRMGVGAQIELTVRRGKDDVKITVPLEVMPPGPTEAPRFISPQLGMMARDRVALDTYTIDSCKNPGGVLVAGVVQRSPAENGELQRNDLITTVNDQPVQSVADMKKIVEGSLKDAPTKPITMVVRRGTDTKNVSIQPLPPQAPQAPAAENK